MSRIVQISELSFATRDRRLILEDLTLSVERGEVVGIVGAPNAGKTLLLELMLGVQRPRGGQILVNDRNVTRLGRQKLLQLRQNLGVLPEQPVWPKQLTLEEALAFKLAWLGLAPRQGARKVDETVATLGLTSLRAARFAKLTPLEQKTAYLALSLCHDPVLMLLDDPFAGMREEGEATLSTLLKQLQAQRNLTVLVTGQRPEPIRRLTQRVLRLQGGALSEGGA